MKKKFTIQKVVDGANIRYPRLPEELSYQDPKEVDLAEVPTGRVSSDTSISFNALIREMAAEFSTASAKFPVEYLGVIENLAIVNPDVSQNVDNIIRLGNTGHKVVVESKNDAQKQRILEEINSMGARAFGKFGGPEGFTNTLLGQIARSGAGSVEWVIDKKISLIEKAVFVPVSTIRFIYDADSEDWHPYQKISDITQGQAGLIELNTNTYQYCGLTFLDNSPYAIPPILAALESVMIQREIIKNFKFVAKKMGLLGFVTFLLKAPVRSGKESDTAYTARLRTYLETQADAIKKNYRDGFALGFKDNFEVTHASLMGSADGADKIGQFVEQQVFSGLKSDPALHGRTYSTTETYAGVVYEKMLSMLSNYQNVAKQILEYGYKLHLVLQGIDYDDLYVEFTPSKSLSSERDETAYGVKLANLNILHDRGIISQDTYAQEAGYDAPDLPEPRVSPNSGGGFFAAEGGQEKTQVAPAKAVMKFGFNRKTGRYFASKHIDPKTVRGLVALGSAAVDHSRAVPSGESPKVQRDELDETFERLWKENLTAHWSGCGCGTGKEHLALPAGAEKFKSFVNKYFRAAYPSIKGARVGAVRDVEKFIKGLDLESLDSEEFADKVFKKLSDSFGDAIDASPLADAVRKQIQGFYKYYRVQDAEPFSETPDGKNIPNPEIPIKPSFDVVDKKAQAFLRESDNFYFGRYIDDPTTKSSLKSWLSDDFLESGRSLKDPGELAKFRERFGDTVGKQDFKVLRVVETSVSRAKNWGNALTMDQADVRTIRVAGPASKDGVICDWCLAMMEGGGKQFQIGGVVDHIKDVMSKSPDDLPDLNPFLPGQFSPDSIKKLSGEQLLAKGIALPPYHPHCRHRVVVVNFK